MDKLHNSRLKSPVTNRVVKAHLLLIEPYGQDIDALGAAFLASIGLDGSSLTKAFKSGGGAKLVMRTKHGILSIVKSDTPLGAAHFNKAIPPLLSAAERSAFMAIICRHEAAIVLKLKPEPSLLGNPAELLHRAVKTLARKTRPLGLLWGPTSRLHQGRALQHLLSTDAPMELLLAPVQETFDRRGSQIIEFTGAQSLLGFDLNLHVGNYSRQEAIRVGLAFAQKCFADPKLQTQPSFEHHGQTLRLLKDAGQISLRPVASFDESTISTLESALKTAA